jgi:tRNA(Ile)-lysidine synthase TilS/MesJ
MKPKHGYYIRPLLETNKYDIIGWLKLHTIAYAMDVSNESLQYLRNRIRSKVLPALHECDERFDMNFLKTLNRLKETELFLERIAQDTFEKISEKNNDVTNINTAQLSTIDPLLHHRIIILWLIAAKVPFTITETFLDEILRFLLSPRGGKHTINTAFSIIKKQHRATIISH